MSFAWHVGGYAPDANASIGMVLFRGSMKTVSIQGFYLDGSIVGDTKLTHKLTGKLTGMFTRC